MVADQGVCPVRPSLAAMSVPSGCEGVGLGGWAGLQRPGYCWLHAMVVVLWQAVRPVNEGIRFLT